jgi:predicted Ser/Thr protein kinase
MNTSPVQAGQILAGKYRIERVLGEGGMGVVVEAHDTGLERRVAIKFLLPEFARHPEATTRFMREARAAVKIQSEHVARVIDVSTLESGSPYMVMEFLEGSDLSQVIEAGGPLPVEDAALYVIQACEALAEAHAHGIIHRDLKPATLFLANQAGGSRKVKVLDFGISKTLTATDPGLLGSLTRTSSMMGSPLYMSPEQMKSARDVDLRTDIWALGVILYESLTGNTPFTGGSIPEISAKILLEDPRPLNQVKPELPQELADVAARALRKQPEMRFQNVADLAMALLPFAPNRARNNVERIVRVLNQAGMAQGEFLASLAPNERAQLLGTPLEVLKITGALASPASLLAGPGGKRKQGTLANFGHTQTERAIPLVSISRRTLVAAGSAVLVLAGGLFWLLRSNAGVAAPPPAAVTAAAPAPAPALPGAPATQPAAAPTVSVAPATSLPEEVAAAEPAAEATKPAAAEPTVQQPRVSAAARATATAAPKPARTSAPAKKTSRPSAKAGGAFKAKFGSRK